MKAMARQKKAAKKARQKKAATKARKAATKAKKAAKNARKAAKKAKNVKKEEYLELLQAAPIKRAINDPDDTIAEAYGKYLETQLAASTPAPDAGGVHLFGFTDAVKKPSESH